MTTSPVWPTPHPWLTTPRDVQSLLIQYARNRGYAGIEWTPERVPALLDLLADAWMLGVQG